MLLIRRRKKLARTLLYGAPLVLLTGALLLIRHFENLGFKDWTQKDWLDLEEVRLLQQYLQIDTSHPDGNEILGAEFLAGVFEKNGIEARVERLGSRQANLIATLPGDDARALVLHNHLDVEALYEPGKALFPPFSGAIDPPFIYGRGAFDMKSYAIAQLLAMVDLKRRGVRPKRSIIFLATSEEERYGLLGARRLLAEHPEWKEELWGVLTEGGAIEAIEVDRARYWGTEVVQKMLVEITVCDSRRERLVDLAEELAGVPRVRRVMPSLAPFLEIYGAYRDRPDTRELLASPETLLARLKAYPRDVDVTVLPPLIEAMLADELKLTSIDRSTSEQGWEMSIVLWVLPERKLEDAWGELIGDRLDGFRYEITQWYPKTVASPLDHPLFTTLDSFMKERYPEVPHGPLFVTWSASESRYFRLAGIPSYGYTPFWILSGDTNSMKGPNERLPLPAFVEGVELYRDLVARLVGAEKKGWFN